MIYKCKKLIQYIGWPITHSFVVFGAPITQDLFVFGAPIALLECLTLSYIINWFIFIFIGFKRLMVQKHHLSYCLWNYKIIKYYIILYSFELINFIILECQMPVIFWVIVGMTNSGRPFASSLFTILSVQVSDYFNYNLKIWKSRPNNNSSKCCKSHIPKPQGPANINFI